MSELRIRGQEVSLRLARNNVPEALLTAIRDFNVQLELTGIQEGYLGEPTMRHDDIFNGTSGSFTVVPEGKALFLLDQFLIARAERRIPINQSRVNAGGEFAFPNGDTPRILVPDMKFDPSNLTIPSRDAYVAQSFSYKTDTAKFITT